MAGDRGRADVDRSAGGTAAGGTGPAGEPGRVAEPVAAGTGPQPPVRDRPRSAADGPRGALVLGLLALGVIGGLWLLARGAPSAAGDPTRPPPTATASVRERFGLEVFPTARAVVRRQPVQIAPLPDPERVSRPTSEARSTALAGAIGTRSAATGDESFGGGGRARPTPIRSIAD